MLEIKALISSKFNSHPIYIFTRFLIRNGRKVKEMITTGVRLTWRALNIHHRMKEGILYSVRALSEEFGVSEQKIWHYMRVLEDKGLVVRVRLRYPTKTFFIKKTPDLTEEKIKQIIPELQKYLLEQRMKAISCKSNNDQMKS